MEQHWLLLQSSALQFSLYLGQCLEVCVYCVPKCKQLYNSKYGHQLSVSQQPVPDYEDVHHTTHSLEHDRHTIELKENVAYGPI